MSEEPLNEEADIKAEVATIGVAALVSGLLLFVTERATVWGTAEFSASIGVRGGLAFAAASVAAAALVGLLFLGSVRVAARVADRSAVAPAMFGTLSALAATPVGTSLAAGAWISEQSWASLVMVAPSAATFVIAAIASWVARRAFAQRRGVWLAMTGAMVAGAVAAVIVDHFVLLGTYIELHLWLWVAAITAATLGLVGLLGPLRSSRRQRIGHVALLVSLAGLAVWMLTPGPVRATLTLGSPIASNLATVTLPALDRDFAARDLAGLDPASGTLADRWNGPSLARADWNVVWITVDTLRADALWPLGPKKRAAWVRPGDTPHLDAWLKDAVVFEHAYAQASATSRSMPPMLRSLESYEDTLELGEPLGAAATRAGRRSIAVLNNWFLEPRHDTTAGMTAGFEQFAIYEKRNQDRIVELFDAMLSQAKGEQFFLWMHFYNMHAPGYDGEMLATKLSANVRYRRSLRWLDRKMGDVLKLLQTHGVEGDTIVVFSADHGEGMGDNRIWNHGPTVYEEEIRVPLAIRIPGIDGHVVEETAGNIDIVPTLWHAMGMPPSVVHRGRSLIGAALGEPLPDAPYYMENYNGGKKAVVVGDQKLVFDDKKDTFLRFDLAGDPLENENLFDETSEVDRRLMSALYRKNPGLVDDPAVAETLQGKLAAVDPQSPGEDLEYLADLAFQMGGAANVSQLVRIFSGATADRARLVVLPAIAKHAPRQATELVTGRLRAMAGTPGEADFVHALADLDAPAARSELVAARFGQHRAIDEVTTRAWLRWMKKWDEPEIGESLARLTDRGAQSYDPATLELLSANIAVARLGEPRDELVAFNRALLEHAESRVRTQAIRTAGRVEDAEAADAVARLLEEGDIRDRKAAMHAYAEIRGEAAVDAIVTAAKDPLLVLDSIRALQKTGSEAALPYLTDIAKNHYNSVIRGYAKSAIKRVRR